MSHPASNGKIERFHRSLSEEGLTEKQLDDKHKTLDIIDNCVRYFNHQRLHAGLKYLRPIDYLNGIAEEKLQKRRKKLTQAVQMCSEGNRNLYKQYVKEQITRKKLLNDISVILKLSGY